MLPSVEMRRDRSPELDEACLFCQHLQDGGPTTRASERALLETDDFVVWPSVGALVVGWVLIVPKAHVLNLAGLTDDLLAQLDRLRLEIKSSLRRLGSPLLSFEHGPGAKGAAAGCGIDHAHLHVVPWPDDVRRDTARRANFMFKPVSGIAAARNPAETGRSYLYVEDTAGQWLATAPNIPSQLVRRVIANSLDAPQKFDWRRFPFDSNTARTIELFQRA
jgi:ATP adenylyltransferase